MKGHMQDGKFHPHTTYKAKPRKKREEKTFDKEKDGVKMPEISQAKLMQMQRDAGFRGRREQTGNGNTT